MAAALIECGFMDSTTDKVILDKSKQRELGIELARIIASHYGLKKKVISKPAASKPIASKKLYRVQVGAYSVKTNAEKLADELKKKGYSAIVVES